jgi:hypothetical protein
MEEIIQILDVVALLEDIPAKRKTPQRGVSTF